MVLERLAGPPRGAPDDDGRWLPPPAVRPVADSDVELTASTRAGTGAVRPRFEFVTPGPGPRVMIGLAFLAAAALVGGPAAIAAAGGAYAGPQLQLPPAVAAAVGGGLALLGLFLVAGLLTPRLRVFAETDTFDPTRAHTLAFSFGQAAAGVNRLRVRVAGQERVTFDDEEADGLRTETHLLSKAVLYDTADGTGGAPSSVPGAGSFVLRLPPDAMHSLRGRRGEIRWTLELQAWSGLRPGVRHNLVLTVWPDALPRPGAAGAGPQ